MIGSRAEKTLNRAIQYAVQHRHEFFTLEHVLWSLLQEARVVEILEICGLDVQVVRGEVEAFLAQEQSGVQSVHSPQEPAAPQPIATLAIQRLVQRALFQIQSSGREEVTPEDLLVALFHAKESQALYLLRKHGLEKLEVLEILSHGELGVEAGKDSDEEAGEGEEDGNPGTESKSSKSASSKESLETYAPSLNQRARQGKIDPLIGRQSELDRMVQVLLRRRKNNPLLLGEAGVGKTALVEGLALRMTEGKVPPLLKNAVIYALDLGALTAGTRYRGDFEARVRKVIDAIERKKASGEEPILFIDEIHTLVGAGSVGGGSMDASNLLKPLLARGELRCIGSTTYAEYRAHFEKDSALSRRFQKIDVNEPTQEQAIEILLGQKDALEKHHGVVFSPEIIRMAVELSVKHVTDRFLPDKALDVLDEVGARVRLAGNQTQPIAVTHQDLEEVIAQIARIPAKSVTQSVRDRLKSLDRDLKLTLFGQDEAIAAVTTAIRLARSGLRTGERPVGSFLFCGPTGVGKTELSKQLAHVLGVPWLRFDMSEYGEKHTVSRLIGAPPGYVGFEQAGQLTEAVLKNPHSVVVLDEIEKAHPDIWNILLQVMDHGRLTDNNGRKSDFRNVIMILTSNVGSRELEKVPMGMGVEASAESQRNDARASARAAVERTFTPEFRNRLDAILIFDPLSPESMSHVVNKQLVELETQAAVQKVDIECDEKLRHYLSRKGYSRSLGARPLGRLIQDEIKKPLANAILFGELEGGGRVLISTEGVGSSEKVYFSFEKRRRGGGQRGKKQKKPTNPGKIPVAF